MKIIIVMLCATALYVMVDANPLIISSPNDIIGGNGIGPKHAKPEWLRVKRASGKYVSNEKEINLDKYKYILGTANGSHNITATEMDYKLDGWNVLLCNEDTEDKNLACLYKIRGYQNQNGTLNKEYIQAGYMFKTINHILIEKITKNCIQTAIDEGTTANNFMKCANDQMSSRANLHNFPTGPHKINEEEMLFKFIEANEKCHKDDGALSEFYLCMFKKMGVLGRDGKFNKKRILAMYQVKGFATSRAERAARNCKLYADNEQTTAMNFYSCATLQVQGDYENITRDEFDERYDAAKKECGLLNEPQDSTDNMLCYFIAIGVSPSLIEETIINLGHSRLKAEYCMKRCVYSEDEDTLERTTKKLHACLYTKSDKDTK